MKGLFHDVWAAPLHGEIVQAVYEQLAGFIFFAVMPSSHCPLSQLWDNDYYLLLLFP